ncbi:RagB/SusD family nutrient uptake outer membrane protein [Hymenobacter sp. M29]|uniref:RagB/SusD family nutrient uptake outer membrane protein n=1 Tax=Hymenobacter mellowenesis TaxID=3063995 RepID=A0ABT9AA47_9BACT|nr:RagB/SusD family nutrient uptake outer membrane protein [Hymenobacter sp. M29]MDO7846259.1 RagB/SusD family nutrient uptake outer membrane protein [Hymenobacter sp. M29]
MKSLRRPLALAVLVAALFSASSCEILDTKPTNFVDPSLYFTNETQLNAALNGVYDELGRNPFYASIYPLVYANNTDESTYTSSSGSNIYSYNPVNSDANVANLWAQLYTGIDRANLLLANMNRAKGVSEASMRHIEGEARFLRAYYYFILAQWWGDVPLKTTPTTQAADGQIAFTPAKDVYDFAIAEMTAADGLLRDQLPTAFPYNERITNTVVEGILARVCLYAAGAPINDTKRYAEALTWAKKVRDSGLHQLHPDFKQVFINMSADAYDLTYRESMWEAGFTYNPSIGTLREQAQTNIGIQNSNNAVGQSNRLEQGTGILYKSYESTVTYSTTTPITPLTDVSPDLRRDWTLAPFSYTTTGTVTTATIPTEVPWTASNRIWHRDCGKWRRQYEVVLPKNATDNGRNWPILRYSDVLLMLAEAENEVNGPTATAFDAINQVRRRGYGLLLSPAPVPAPPAATAVNLTGLSQAGLRQAIRDERMRELAFEALRRQDLKRWGILVPRVIETANIALSGSPETLPNGLQRVPPTTDAPANYTFYRPNVDANDILLPIPIVEIINNKLAKQNPGY